MNTNVYLTSAEAAEYTRFRQQTIYDMVKLNRIPHIKARKKLLFNPAELEIWLNNGATDEVAKSIMNARRHISTALLEVATNSKTVAICSDVDIHSIIEQTLKTFLETK
ncbi:MAG: helix-turn-helix domain-containing protein [Deferribacteraceae bacterium]|jgi:excisionase family DNA binding protein|nr:helix-turn-helix domain-containing protein [Deferribacteraceae bacterium]